MNGYKSQYGMNQVRQATAELYARWPIPVTQSDIELGEFGATHVLEMGDPDGVPLVLLHGSASNSASWMGYAPKWATRYRVIALDMPGQPGLSEDSRLSLADGSMGRWLSAALTALSLKSLLVCGMSLGSWIALDFLIHQNEASSVRPRGLCLITTSGITAPRRDFFLKALPLMFFGSWGAKRINKIVHGPVPVDPQVEEFSLLVAKHHKPLLEEIPIFSDDELRGVEVPLLYLGGSEDALLDTAATAARIDSLIPNSEVVVLDAVGHVIADQGKRILDAFDRMVAAPVSGA